MARFPDRDHRAIARERTVSRRAVAQLGDPQAYLYDMNAYAEENKRLPLDAEMEFAVGAGI